MSLIHYIILGISSISVAALAFSYWNSRNIDKIDARVEEKSRRLDKLESSIKKLAADIKNL